jgi:signal transduction histidine kinase
VSKAKTLNELIYVSFLKNSLIPIFVIEITLIIVYFAINNFTSDRTKEILLNETEKNIRQILNKEINIFDTQLKEIKTFSYLLQDHNQRFFKNFDKDVVLPNGKVELKRADNGVLYKANNNGGSSVWYSSKTKIGKKELRKAINTEVFDPLFKFVVDNNKLVVAAYFNSYDNFNRYYPFLENVYSVFGAHMVLKDYNFYYDADAKHNPDRKSVWTDAYLDPAGQGWMVSCIVPIYNNDFLEGVTGMDVTLDLIFKHLSHLEIPYSGKSFLIGKDGQILAMPDEIRDYFKENSINIKDFINKDVANLMIDNKKYLVGKEVSKETNWQLYTMIDEDIIFSKIYKIAKLTKDIGYLAIVLMIVFYVIFFLYMKNKSKELSKNVAKPIEDLVNITRDMGKDSNKIKLARTNIKEIDILSYNFKQKTEELERNYKELQIMQSEKLTSLGSMVAGVAHEINTPVGLALTGITHNQEELQALEDDYNNDSLTESSFKSYIKNAKELNRSISINLKKAAEIIRSFKRVAVDQVSDEDREFALKQYVEEILSSLYNQIKKTKHKITVNVDDDLKIYSSPGAFSQILTNLIMNSFIHGFKEKEEGEILIEATMSNDTLKLVYKDNGAGLDETAKRKIFDPFYTTNRAGGGSGLGMNIVFNLVTKKLNGTITLNSAKNKGVEFVIKIPVSQCNRKIS